MLAFPEKVKPLCNNKLAFEKVVLFYGILWNVCTEVLGWYLLKYFEGNKSHNMMTRKGWKSILFETDWTTYKIHSIS